MSNDTTYIDQALPTINAAWLNDVGAAVWGGIGTGRNGTPPTTPAQVKANLAITAPDVSYTPSGAGAVATMVSAKLQQIVSVFDFMTPAQIINVQANLGTVDVTGAIQAAVNSLTIGGTLWFPPGTYLVSSQITASASILFLGAGCNQSIITTNSATANLIDLNFRSCGVEHLGFASSVTRTTGAYIYLEVTANYSHVKNFQMTGYGIGIVTNGGVTQWFSEGNMFAPVANAIGFQALNNGNDLYLRNITMSANALVSTATGINLVYTGAVNITDCDIIRHGQCLLLNPGNGQLVVDVYALNSYFDTASNGVNVNPSGTGLVQGLRLLGCWSSAHTGSGIITQGTGTITGLRIIDLQCYSNGTNGITHGNGSDLHVLGGVFAGHTAGSGVSIAANLSAFSVVGARMGNPDLKPANINGIFIAAGTSNEYVIVGNDLSGNSGSGLVDGGTGTIKKINGNIGITNGASSAITVTASPFTYTAGALPEMVYLNSGTVSLVVANGIGIYQSSNCGFFLYPNSTAVITYTVAPFMNKTILNN